MSIDDLAGAVGDSQSSEYDDDSATGTTGYYYYPDFTVSTSVDRRRKESLQEFGKDKQCCGIAGKDK